MTLSKTTKNHEEIRKWAEGRGAVPAEVASTERNGEPGIIRFEFPKAPHRNDSKLKQISWDDFFEKFDENNLELVYQEKTADGQKSNFNKLVHPSSEEHSSRGSHSGSHGASGSSHSGRTNKSESNSGHSKTASHSSESKSHKSASGASHSTASKSHGESTHAARDRGIEDDLDTEDDTGRSSSRSKPGSRSK